MNYMGGLHDSKFVKAHSNSSKKRKPFITPNHSEPSSQIDEKLYDTSSKLPDFMEDHSSMFSWWTARLSGESLDSFETDIWHPLLLATDAGFNLPSYRFSRLGVSSVSARRSLRHLSTIELLAIQRAINEKSFSQMVLRPFEMSSAAFKAELLITAKAKNEGYVLDYQQDRLLLKLLDQSTCKAKMKLHLRNGCLEEITGNLFGQNILIDPIWEKNKDSNKENLRLGMRYFSWRTLRARKDQVAFSKGVHISIKMTASKKFKQRFFCVDKTIRVNSIEFKVRQLFATRWLVPILAAVKWI